MAIKNGWMIWSMGGKQEKKNLSLLGNAMNHQEWDQHIHTKFEDKHKYKGITLQKRPGLTDQEQRTNGPVNLFLH